MGPTRQVNPIHFEDFSAIAFERLVLAFHVRTGRWRSIEWYGQLGSDLGRDIIATRDDDSLDGEIVCIQCANHRKLPATKVLRDIDKALSSATPPRVMRFVCGGAVTADTRTKASVYATKKHLRVELWSGGDFEERLHHQCESLLKRFTEGVAFPDAPEDLSNFARDLGLSEDEAVRLLAALFDRPAFYTPFRHESSVPAFRHALDDTIRALSTGMRQTREGTPLPKIASRHELADEKHRGTFAEIERGVAGLRARLDQLMRSGDIRACADSCANPQCSVYFFSDAAIRDMDEIRARILAEISQVSPSFTVRVDW